MNRMAQAISHALDVGNHPLPEWMTPTTTTLLHWWFGHEQVRLRGEQNFHEGQRWAILNTIVAHEAPHAVHRQAPLLHRVRLLGGLGRTPVLLALLVWQLLNRMDALAAHIEDTRFTRHFMGMAPHPRARDRLLGAFCGHPLPGAHGARDFGTADLVQLAPLLLPPERRDDVFGFVCGNVCSGPDIARMTPSDGVIVIADGRLEALEFLARLPDLMVFDDEVLPQGPARVEGQGRAAWCQHLRRVASAREGCCIQVVFSAAPSGDGHLLV